MSKSKFVQSIVAVVVALGFIVGPVAAAPALESLGINSGVSAQAAFAKGKKVIVGKPGWVTKPRWTYKRLSNGSCRQEIHQMRGLYRNWAGVEYLAWTGPETNMGGRCAVLV